MTDQKKFLPLDQVKFEESINFREVRTWLPLTVPSSLKNEENEIGSKSSKRKKFKKCSEASLINYDCSPSSCLPDDKKKSKSSRKNTSKSLLTASNGHKGDDKLESRVSKNIISLDEMKRSFEHYGEIIQVKSPYKLTDNFLRPPSQTPSEILPYVFPKDLVSMLAPQTGIIINETPQVSANQNRKNAATLDFNPRTVQKEIDQSGEKFYIQDRNGHFYAIPLSSSLKSSQNRMQKWSRKSLVKSINQSQNVKDRKFKHKKTQKSICDLKLTLGFPVGIELGSFSIDNTTADWEHYTLTSCILAIAKSFLKPEVKWSSKTIDNLLQNSELLAEVSALVKGKSQGEISIIPLNIDNVQMEIKYGSTTVIGSLGSLDPGTLDIYQGLIKIRRSNIFVIFRCRNRIMAIWKHLAWYVFDPCGRSNSCVVGDKAALISLNKLENVTQLIVNMSDLKENSTYTLSTVKIVRIGENEATSQKPTSNEEPNYITQYKVINGYHAILFSPFHLRHAKFYEAKNQSMAMSIAALFYSKVFETSKWTVETLSQITATGNHLFKQWSCNVLRSTLKDLPKSFQVENQNVMIQLDAFLESVPVLEKGREHGLFENLKKLLKSHSSLLLQVDRMYFAVWTQNDVFYLFDPYPRDEQGDVCIDQLGYSCVQVFSFLQHLSQSFRRNMIQLAPNSKIYIHAVATNTVQLDQTCDLMEQKLPDFVVNTQIPELELLPSKEEKDEILILDSPSPSITSLDQICQLPSDSNDINNIELPTLDEKQLSKLTLTFESNRLKAGAALKSIKQVSPSPSTEYLCHKITEQITVDIMDQITLLEKEKCSKKRKTNTEKTECPTVAKIARKILLKSDLPQLENKRKVLKMQKSQPNERCFEVKEYLDKATLFINNYIELPDNSSIIFGTKSVFDSNVDLHLEYFFVAVAVSAVAVSYKYSVDSWNNEIIDFVLEISDSLAKGIKSQPTAFFSYPNHSLPDFEIGSKRYNTRLEMVEVTKFNKLSLILPYIFRKLQRILLISPITTVAIFKQKTYFYMYEGFPCDMLGFCTKEGYGAACMTRFTTIKALLRRLNINKRDTPSEHGIIISQLLFRNTPDQSPSYPELSSSKVELLVENIKLEKLLHEEEKRKLLQELDTMISEEKERIVNFCQEKKDNHCKPQLNEQLVNFLDSNILCERFDRMIELRKSVWPLTDNNTNQFPQNGDERLKSKKKTNNHYARLPLPKLHFLNSKPPSGYIQYDQDLRFKIQGSTALSLRFSFISKQIRACYFACSYAALLTLHYQIEKWNYRKMDLCLENGIKIFNQVSEPNIVLDRQIENISVADMIYNIIVSSVSSNSKPRAERLAKVLENEFKRNNFLIIQFMNCCFGLYNYGDLYHVFDPYSSMEINDELQVTLTMQQIPEVGTLPLTPEHNTASWVLCQNLGDLVEYLKPRVTKSTIEEEYLLYTVGILSFRKASKSSILSHLLYKSCDDVEEQWLCGVQVEEKLHPEEIHFVEEIKIPWWSRLLPCNLIKQVRYTEKTKIYGYDVEIPLELYSIWGNISPLAPIFNVNLRGKQYLAINAISCACANLYHLNYWNSELIDSVVVHGDRYFSESIEGITDQDHTFELNDLNREFSFFGIDMFLSYTPILHGFLYSSDQKTFNLSRALTYFFKENSFGILILKSRALAVGKDPLYFMFDCQSSGEPLFTEGQGTAYLLCCCSLRRLLECILVTLNVTQYTIPFALYSVNIEFNRNGSQSSLLNINIREGMEDDR